MAPSDGDRPDRRPSSSMAEMGGGAGLRDDVSANCFTSEHIMYCNPAATAGRQLIIHPRMRAALAILFAAVCCAMNTYLTWI